MKHQILLCLLVLQVFSKFAFAQSEINKKMEPLNIGDVGTYEELSKRPNPQNLYLLYIPGIEALLARAEELNKAPLSDDQVQLIRLKSNVLATEKDLAEITIKDRGYN
ncbi:hypothetical protein [Rheinheimera baltica]|uniref:hypothetical protein n=1 Tax=Rheinheimera baltica TaxID=67576 RepID=UPI00273F6B43|nr:hypothetical protein [Rheinheimera baltica]MDP5189534.1 hypothetical protein [Rheinheimera baltica]